MLRQLAFRKRLLLILSLFALVPAVAMTVAWAVAVRTVLLRVSENAAWEQVASSGTRALDSLRGAQLSPGQRAALAAHEQNLAQSVTQARRFDFVAARFARVMIVGAIVGLVLLGVLASRVAAHLSRQMSRPLNELLGWAELIARGAPLPRETPLRGAPEFNVLRQRMRTMAVELAEGRARALEAERQGAFRESARRFAHELKNPLTPIQFALARLERDAPPELADTVDVLKTETGRLNAMSKSFSQFGRLPEGPMSEVDVGELVRYGVRSVVPPDLDVQIDVPTNPVVVRGQHDALQRALTNILLNAVDACTAANSNGDGAGHGGEIRVTVEPSPLGGGVGVAIRVRDTGCGIPPERIESIWDPYVTSKPGGTGLGLAIARQTILAHHGSVAVESTPGRGTEICLVLPVAADSQLTAEA